MKKFRFVGDPQDYSGDFKKGEIYLESLIGKSALYSEQTVGFLAENDPKDWEEVYNEETEKIKLGLKELKATHKETDLGYFSIEIIKAVFQSPSVSTSIRQSKDGFIYDCIDLAKELIKQLDAESK